MPSYLCASKPARFLLLLAFIAGVFVICVDVRQSMRKALSDPNDFVTLYAGAICTTSGCDPYDISELDSVLRKQRGTTVLQDWRDQLPIYPPTTILLLKPFAKLSYQKATLVWYLVSFAIYAGGVFWVFAFSPCLAGEPPLLRAIAILLALHFPKLIQCLSFGNPSLAVTGLMLFSVFDDLDRRFLSRVLCASIAVWLKFTSALPLMLLVLFASSSNRKRAWAAASGFAIVTGAILFTATHLPGMHHWAADLGSNLALGEQNGMSVSAHISPSNVLLNAANLPGYFTQSSWIIFGFVFLAVGALSVLLVIALASCRSAKWGQSRYQFAVAAVAVMSLLPVYHRFCDIGLLLFVLPWLVRRISRRVDFVGVAVTAIMALLYFSWERRINLNWPKGLLLRIVEFLYYRGDALLVFILAVLLVTAMFRETVAGNDRTAAA